MSYQMDYPISAAEAPADARATFIRRTYGHLAGAILAFIGVEYVLLQLPNIDQIAFRMTNGYNWLLVVGAMVGVSWLADSWARSDTSRGMQYAGLALYVLAQAVIFIPLLYLASTRYPEAIPTAGIMTLMVFAGLSATVLITKRDFSFLRPILMIGSLLSLGAIVAGMLLGFSLGLFFCYAMVALASGYIIYQTSALIHEYRTDQYVAASLGLFASVALLFWYILRIVMASSRE